MTSSREKRRKRKREPSPESKPTPRSSSPIPPTPESSSPIPSLPYDLVLLCVARVSRLYYPTLSLVSKSFRSLVSSPEIYKTRSLFGFAESCLYVCLQSLGGRADWYTLCRKPDKTLKTKTGSSTSGYALAKVHVPESPLSFCSFGRNMVAVGSSIYIIAFPRSLNVLPRVSVLDCKSHTGWIEAPSLPVELHSFSSSVVDHKIYVAGLDHRLKKNSFQVFDTETGVWDSVSTGDEGEEMFWEKSFSIDGKFHVATLEEVLAYDPKVGNWDMVVGSMGWRLSSDAYCVIGNVLYSVSEGVFEWYDTERRMWRDLLGLVGLPKISGRREAIRLGDYGGKMMVFWGQAFWDYYRSICCAEIALERRPDSYEIWGNVEWSDELLKINPNYQVENVLSTTL